MCKPTWAGHVGILQTVNFWALCPECGSYLGHIQLFFLATMQYLPHLEDKHVLSNCVVCPTIKKTMQYYVWADATPQSVPVLQMGRTSYDIQAKLKDLLTRQTQPHGCQIQFPAWGLGGSDIIKCRFLKIKPKDVSYESQFISLKECICVLSSVFCHPTPWGSERCHDSSSWYSCKGAVRFRHHRELFCFYILLPDRPFYFFCLVHTEEYTFIQMSVVLNACQDNIMQAINVVTCFQKQNEWQEVPDL